MHTSMNSSKKRFNQIQDKESVDEMNIHFALGSEYFYRLNYKEWLKSHNESLILKKKVERRWGDNIKSYL